MRPGQTFFRVLMMGTAIGFTIISGIGIALPTLYVKILQGQTSASLNSHFRYLNVLFLSYALMAFLLFRDGNKYRLFLPILAFGMLGGFVVRTVSIFIDGVPIWLMLAALVGELGLGVLYLISYRLSLATSA